MKTFYSIIFILVLFTLNGLSQTIAINGKVFGRDQNKEIVGGAVVLNPGNKSVSTNSNGEFSFKTSPGSYRITVRALGYQTETVNFKATSDTTLNIYLQVAVYELGEITVVNDSVKSIGVTSHGSILLTPASIKETPKLFGEPDLIKSFQLLPGVISGKDGSADIYVRGGGIGQNIILANGCYFFLPSHLLGLSSSFDIDFLETAELFKDYSPPELGGGAASVISLDFKECHSDSLRGQLRLGLLSSGINAELPLSSVNTCITFGLKRSNYRIYSPLIKKLVKSDVAEYLPPDNYLFSDGYLQISHTSAKAGKIRYLYFRNTDSAQDEDKTTSFSTDTLVKSTTGLSTGWSSVVHALKWDPLFGNKIKWQFYLNYNRITMDRSMYTSTYKFINETELSYAREVSNSFSPSINNIGASVIATGGNEKINFLAGISEKLRLFNPNVSFTDRLNDQISSREFGDPSSVIESSAFFSAGMLLMNMMHLDAGLRFTTAFTDEASFYIPEPRFRIALWDGKSVSPHINYIRLSQLDHSVEGSNAGLRNILWLPVYKDFGPEISDIVSAGIQGKIKNDFVWTIDCYYKSIAGMIDFKPGASFIFDTTFTDMIDRTKGISYGLETGVIKRTGKLTGTFSYTWSRSKREWNSPEGMIWIPSNADRPHSVNLSLKYYCTNKTSFGLNWVYQSGAPATIYMHETSYLEWFETKNNIRYLDYHRLDLSYRQIIYKKKFSILLDIDVYNVYNRKNTFYFKKEYDEETKLYYYRNVSIFPIMPSISLTLKY